MDGFARPAEPHERIPIGPPGHSRSAHTVLGWCAHCRTRSVIEEVIAWRTHIAASLTEMAGYPPGPKGTRTIGVDFDGVLHSYHDGWRDGTIYGGPVPGSREAIHHLLERYAVAVFTTREHRRDVADAIRDWYGVPAVPHPPGEPVGAWSTRGTVLVTNVKIPMIALIDDRAVLFGSGGWGQALADVEERYGHHAVPIG